MPKALCNMYCKNGQNKSDLMLSKTYVQYFQLCQVMCTANSVTMV